MTLRTGIGVLLLALGVLVVVIAAVGLFRFRRTLDLLQASALADTLGLFLITAGLLVLCGFTVHSAKLILAAVILWTVNPVAAHLIARMEVLTGWSWTRTSCRERGNRSCDGFAGGAVAGLFDLSAPSPPSCAGGWCRQ